MIIIILLNLALTLSSSSNDCDVNQLRACEGSLPCIDLREGTLHHHIMILDRIGKATVTYYNEFWKQSPPNVWTCFCKKCTDRSLAGEWLCEGFYTGTISISNNFDNDFTPATPKDHIDVCAERNAEPSRFCVAVGSEIKGVYDDVESAREKLGEFNVGYRMVCEMQDTYGQGVRALDPHRVRSESGVRQHYSHNTDGLWNAWWWDWSAINDLMRVCNTHAPCTAPIDHSNFVRSTATPTLTPTSNPTSTSTTCKCTGLGTECQDVMDMGYVTDQESCEAYHGGNACSWSCDSEWPSCITKGYQWTGTEIWGTRTKQDSAEKCSLRCKEHGSSCKFWQWHVANPAQGWSNNCQLHTSAEKRWKDSNVWVGDASCLPPIVGNTDSPTLTPTSIPTANPTSMIYRVSNNVHTGWRPAVTDVHVYSDSTCTTEIDATFEGSSGGYSSATDGSKAFDGLDGTSWRPQCHPCAIGEAWLSFSVSVEIKCVEAFYLGEGRGGSATWNGGIKVEKQNSDGTWTPEMESTNGNSASKSEGCQSSFLSYNGKCYGTVDWNLQPEPVRFNTPVSSSADNCDIEEWHEIPDGCQLAPATRGITGDVVGKFEFGTYLLILANGGAYQNPTYGAGAGKRLLNNNFLQMGPTNRHYKTKCCGCKLLLQCDLGFGTTSSPTATPTLTPTSNPSQNPTATPTQTPTSNPTQNPTATPTLTPTRNPSTSPSSMPIVTDYEKLACHWVPDHKYALADGTGPEYEYGSLMECFEKCDADPECLGFLDRSSGGKKICAWKSDEKTLQQSPNCGNDYYRKPRSCQSSFLSYNGKCYGTVDWNLQPEPVRFNTPVSSSADNCDIEEWHEIPDGCQLAPATRGITGDVVGKFEFGTYLLILSNGGAYQNPTYGAGAGKRLLNNNFLQMGPTNRHYKTKCCGCKLLLQCDLGFGLETNIPTANPTIEPTATPTVNPTEACYDTPSWSNGWNGCEVFAEKNLCAKYGHRDFGKGKANDHCCVCGGGRTEPNTDPYVWRGDWTGNCAAGSTPIRTNDECEAAARFFSESDTTATVWRYHQQGIPSGCWVYLNVLYFNNDPNQWNWTGNNGYIKTFCKAEDSTQSNTRRALTGRLVKQMSSRAGN